MTILSPFFGMANSLYSGNGISDELSIPLERLLQKDKLEKMGESSLGILSNTSFKNHLNQGMSDSAKIQFALIR